MGQPRPLFVYFPFSHQVESNSDHTDPSRPLYPLDHNHGPKGLFSLSMPKAVTHRRFQFVWLQETMPAETIEDIFTLSTSRYSEVRTFAQELLIKLIGRFVQLPFFLLVSELNLFKSCHGFDSSVLGPWLEQFYWSGLKFLATALDVGKNPCSAICEVNYSMGIKFWGKHNYV